jgi:glycosidase
MPGWADEAIFYNLFPLGALGAPEQNHFAGPPADRVSRLSGWLGSARDIGANAILLGPVFESSRHGYDTADLFTIDRRLGTNEAFAAWVAEAHAAGFRVVLDGVFHHVGRDFWAFRDVIAHGEASAYRAWFHLDFSRRSPFDDPFFYQGWNKHYDLVKLNLEEPAVREHLFAAARMWIEQFGIDGLRLDAADVLDRSFQRDLAGFCRACKPDFWLMGEVIHRDYGVWIREAGLDSVTNYELHKGLWSSHNDRNYFELAHTLARQFADGGIYKGLQLYTFLDNHDVERIASRLREAAHLTPVHILLFTVPGTPSIYYGSEWGIPGRKTQGSDAPLRPALDPESLPSIAPHQHLPALIRQLARLRREHAALRTGSFRQLHLASQQFAFAREAAEDGVIVAVNAEPEAREIAVSLDGTPLGDGAWADALAPNVVLQPEGRKLRIPLAANSGRVLVRA